MIIEQKLRHKTNLIVDQFGLYQKINFMPESYMHSQEISIEVERKENRSQYGLY